LVISETGVDTQFSLRKHSKFDGKVSK